MRKENRQPIDFHRLAVFCQQTFLQNGIAVGINQGVQLLSLGAEGAAAGFPAAVIDQVVGVEDVGDGDAADFLDRGEDGGDADHFAAAAADGLHGGIRGIARGHAGQQDQHVLIGDHGHGVFTEDQLAAGGVFRGDLSILLCRPLN